MKKIVSAIISGIIVAVLGYVVSLTDIWAVSFHTVLNIAVMTACASILKAMGTTDEGTFAGIVKIKQFAILIERRRILCLETNWGKNI